MSAVLRMMRLASVISGVLFFATIARAQEKFGVLDMQAVILAVDEGKKARAELEAEIKAKEKEFEEKKKGLDKLNEDWKKQAAMLSESARMQKQQEFQEKVSDR